MYSKTIDISSPFMSLLTTSPPALTSVLLVEGVHAGEIHGQRLERGRQAHAALGALHAAVSSSSAGRSGAAIVALSAHGHFSTASASNKLKWCRTLKLLAERDKLWSTSCFK